ncbi:MAG: hypothetical protein AB7P17_12660 [Nitrospirales bacterium]|nr:hypothetical protein [Nitrospirales bacterium]
MSKKEADLQSLRHGFMMRKFFLIIRHHRVEQKTQRLQQGHDGVHHGVGAPTGDLGDMTQSGFPLGEGGKSLLMAFVDHGIHFPTGEAAPAFEHGRPMFDRESGSEGGFDNWACLW